MSRRIIEQYQKGNHEKAFKYWKRATDSGDVEARKRLAYLYRSGLGVEKDTEKEIYHLEEAAIGVVTQ